MTNQLEQEVSFKTRLKYASEQGLLLFVKYGLLVILAWFTVSFINNVVAGSQNGTASILYINEAINKGYLPKAVNGALPNRDEHEKTSFNSSNPIK